MFVEKYLLNKYLQFIGLHFTPRTFTESFLKFGNTQPLLLVGLPRSGTSMTQTLLNHFDKVFVSYESMIEPYIFENNKFKLSSYFYETLRQSQHLTKRYTLVDDSAIKAPPYDCQYKYLGNKSIFGQNKKYQKKLAKVITSNKDLKTIFILREPKDRLLSILKWQTKRNNLYVETSFSQPQIRNVLRNEIKRSNDFSVFVSGIEKAPNTLVLKYEDLVSSVQYVDNIKNFLNLEDASQAVNFFNERVSQDSVKKWSSDMPEIIRNILEEESQGIVDSYYPLA
jgi:hypothetical protein